MDKKEYIVANIAPRLSGRQVECVPVDPIGEGQRCHANVTRHVQEHGGKRIEGWVFVSSTSLAIEAVWHSVWASESGALVDITPDPQELFLYEGGSRLFLPSDDPRKEGDFFFPTTRNKALKRAIRKIAHVAWETRRLDERQAELEQARFAERRPG